MKDEMASIRFKTHFHSHELSELELPVEIRHANMRLAAKTLTTKEVKLEPGEYFITSRLPAGQQLDAYLKVQPGESYEVELSPESLDQSPSEDLEVQHFLRRSVRETRPIDLLSKNLATRDKSTFIQRGRVPPVHEKVDHLELESQPISLKTQLECRWFRGNVLSDTATVELVAVEQWQVTSSQPLTIQIPTEANDVSLPVICQLRQPGLPDVNVRIPIPQFGSLPTISIFASGPLFEAYRIGIRLAHETADLLTRYIRRGMYSEANGTVASDSMTGENLLYNKMTNPIAASVGSYALLRMGDLSSLHEWTANLMDFFEWLPDGAAIRGEHEARRGKHLEACRAFLRLEHRGLPLFIDGMSYALDRLRLYDAASSKLNGLEPTEREAVSRLNAKLERFIPFLEFDRTYVTYAGTDPIAPGTSEKKNALTIDASSPQFGTRIPSSKGENALMSNGNDNDQEFFFNGVDATTGEYLESPKSAKQLAAIALSDSALVRSPFVMDANAKHLRELDYRSQVNKTESFGPRFGVDVGSVASAGWAVVFAKDTDPRIKEALSPLLALRAEQAGMLYKECNGPNGYVAGESKDDFLTRNGAGPGPAVPERFPFYVMLVGDPEAIPYKFQYQLDVIYAVGRIWFDTIEEYSRYAQSVVHAESGKISLPRQAAFFGPQNPNDRATRLSSEQLLAPLAHRAEERGRASGWTIDRIIGNDASRSRLTDYLGGSKTPALLFTASHGMGFPLNDHRQNAYQGALLCQDWNGPGTGPVDRSHYFAAEDIVDSAKLAGLICFHFACYGAGTPRLDDFAYQQFQKPKAIATKSFVAALPRRMLGHPSGGALAAIGHIERAWGCSIVWRDAGAQIQAFEDAVDVLMQGMPVGYALESINQRYADLSSALSGELLDIREGRKPADDYAIANQWTANNDARSYVIIGDPAVRLPLAPVGAAAPERVAVNIAPIQVTSTQSALAAPADQPPPGSADAASTQTDFRTKLNRKSTSMAAREISMTIPLKVTVNVTLSDMAQTDVTAEESVGAAAGIEAFKVEIDPDYEAREGYDTKFLGTGRTVPLPQLSSLQLADAAKIVTDSGDESIELKYHHYSVVHNSKRKLAFFTAVNIDGTKADRPTRERDKWFFDPRIPKSQQAGEDLYSDNDLDRGHLVRRLDPAWGRSAAIIKRANDDTFHFTNCSPQHSRFNQGKKVWAGLEDYLLDKATDEDRRLTVFTGPVFSSSDPVYRGIPIPKKYWKVAVLARPNRRIAALGFIVDQEKLLRRMIAFGPEEVAETFQVPISEIETLTGLNFGRLTTVDAGSVDSFAVGASPLRQLDSLEDIALPRSAVETPTFSPGEASSFTPTDMVEGTDVGYYLVAYDKDGRERRDHRAGQVSRLVTQAVSDSSVTDVVLFSHGWQGDVPSARRQYQSWIGTMASNHNDRQRIRQKRPGFKPVLIGVHWPSQPWGDENLRSNSFSDSSLEEYSLAAELEEYTERLGDSPDARERIRPSLRRVLELTQSMTNDPQGAMPPELEKAYLELDAAIGLGAQGLGSSPSADRDPFDPSAVFQHYQELFPQGDSVDVLNFGGAGGSWRDRFLSPLRTLSFWKMKDRARSIGENAVHDLLVRLQQTTAGRNVRYHLIGHSFGCIVVTAATTGAAGSTVLPQPIDSLTLLQGALSLWSYCSQLPYSSDTAGYFHNISSKKLVRGPIVTTRSTHDTAVGRWYPLASRMNRSFAFDAPAQFPKYGGIGTFGIQGPGLAIEDITIAENGTEYQFARAGAITNVEASRVISGHSEISKPDVAHLVWSAIGT